MTLPSEAARLRYPYPVEQPETLRLARDRIGDVSAVLTDTRADVNDDTLLLEASWSSDTAYTAVSDVRTLAGVLLSDSGQLATAAAAISGYVTALETARDDIDALRVRYDAAVDARDAANDDVPDASTGNRYEREEYRKGNQTQLDGAADLIDIDYDEVMAALDDKSWAATNDLTAVLDVLSPRELRGSGGYGEGAYHDATIGLSLAAAVAAAADPRRRARSRRRSRSCSVVSRAARRTGPRPRCSTRRRTWTRTAPRRPCCGWGT